MSLSIVEKWRRLMPKGAEPFDDFIAREKKRGAPTDSIELEVNLGRRTPSGWLRIPTVPGPNGQLVYTTDHYRFVAADGDSIVEVWFWESEDRPRFVAQYGRTSDEKPVREFYDDRRDALDRAIQKMIELYIE